MQPKVLDILLAYTYTDVAPFDLALICELYAAADTLLMHDLRDKAVEYLERNMRTEFIVPCVLHTAHASRIHHAHLTQTAHPPDLNSPHIRRTGHHPSLTSAM